MNEAPDLSDALEGVDPAAVWAAIRPELRPTLALESPLLDEATGARVRLYSETLQHTGSFKLRAALGAARASAAPRLLTASSGNFGAALAFAAARCGKGCTVVMPSQSAQVKIEAVRRHGAAVELVDTDRTSRAARLAELAAADPAAAVISPYDDPNVIAGNGSLGAEIFSGGELPDCLVAPVGGGGLSAGLCVARDRLAPGCDVIGAEPALANDAARSLRAGRLVRDEREAPTICDGARTLALGVRNYAILRRGLAAIVEVEERTVVAALRLLYRVNLKAEPTGALALAALLQSPERFRGRRVACVVSGGNVDAALYARLLTQDGADRAPGAA